MLIILLLLVVVAVVMIVLVAAARVDFYRVTQVLLLPEDNLQSLFR